MKKINRLDWIYLITLLGCYPVDERLVNNVVVGYVPVYGDKTMSEIKLSSPKAVKNPGKIYLYKQYLLVNEVNEGIHIFDNADPASPKAVGFIGILGNVDMAIKSDILYADHLGDLVALEFGTFASIKTTGRLPLNSWLLGVPPPKNFSFECIDPGLGIVVGWRKKDLTNPDCYAF